MTDSAWHNVPLVHADWSKVVVHVGGCPKVPGVVRKGRRPNVGDSVRFQDTRADMAGMGKVVERDGDHVVVKVTWTFASALDGMP